MIIQSYKKDEIEILKVSGEITYENYQEFEQNLLNIVEGNNKVILDLSGLKYLNSMGISSIVKVYSFVKKSNGEMILNSLNENIKKLFIITKLDSIIKIYDSLDEAIKYFNIH